MAAPQFFRLSDFSGGLNLDQHPVLLKDNQAVEILNFSLRKPGSLISRRGYTAYTTATLDGDVVQLGRFESPSSDTASLLAHLADGSIQLIDSTSATSLATGFGTTKGSFLSAQDATFYANGETRPIMYNGTTTQELGIEAPTSLSAAAAAGGSLSEGEYVYAISFYDSTQGIETNLFSADAVTVSSTNLTVDLTIPTSSDSRVDKVRIYRTVAGGSVLQFLDQIDEGTTSYSDDGSKTLNPFLGNPGGNFSPAPKLENLAYLGGWYFGSIGRDLYWSLPLDPHHWPPLNTTEVPFLGNDEVVALVAHQDTLIIFGHQNILAVSGQGPNWTITRLDAEVGVASRDAAVEMGGQVIFLSHDGLRAFPGLSIVAPALTRTLSGVTTQERSQTILTHVADDRELWITVDGETYVVFLPTQAVTKYNLNPVATLSGGVDGESSPILAESGGSVLAEYGGTDDNGTDISLRWSSKTFQLPNPEKTKYLRRLGGYTTIGSQVDVQLIPMSGATFTATLESIGNEGQELWQNDDGTVGTFNWGDIWTTEGLDYKVAALPAHTLKGNTFKIILSATTDESTEIAPPLTILYRESNRLLGE